MSEVDWLLPEFRTKIKMIRQFNRMLNMDEGRLTKKVYLWDRSLNEQNVVSSWTNEVKSILYSCGLSDVFDNETMFPLKSTIEEIKEKFKIDQADYLKNECMNQRKLRTFNKFKLFGTTPAYVTKPMTFYQRKQFAKLRLGSLELRIETGRFARPRLEIHERICLLCSESRRKNNPEPEIESEMHFLFFCDKLTILRDKWFSNIKRPDNFESLSEGERLSIVLNMDENCKPTAQFITDAYCMRNKILN